MKKTIFSLLGSLAFIIVKAQISPPGLGKETNVGSWSALGIKKQLNEEGTKKSLAYIGVGNTSEPNNDNPFSKNSILILNYEMYRDFAPNHQYTYAVSYSRKNEYSDEAPYNKEGVRQEFKIYARYSYTLKPFNHRWKWKNTLRQEVRKFYDADFNNADETLQLRTRVKAQLTYALSSKNNQKLHFGAEAFFGTGYKISAEPSYWSPFQYKETRYTFFYSFDIPSAALTLDIGYMNNQVRNNPKAKYGVHYAAIDLIWNLPYR